MTDETLIVSHGSTGWTRWLLVFGAAEQLEALVGQGRVIEAVKLLRERKKLPLTDAKREVDEVRAGLR